MMVSLLYLLPLFSIIHIFLSAKANVRTVALAYSLITFIFACFLWYIAEFDSNNLAYILDVRLDFVFPIHYFSAVDSISFCFILLSLLLYSRLYSCFLGIYHRKSKRVL